MIVKIKSELKKSELDQIQMLAIEVIKQWRKIRVLVILEYFTHAQLDRARAWIAYIKERSLL